jgi:hypothetical protein
MKVAGMVESSALRVRAATDADAARVIELVNAAFAIEEFMEGTRTDAARLAALMETGTILVAEDGGGALLASAYVEARGARGYLGMLAVDPAHQGRGLAKLLVEAAEEHLRREGCEALEITVLSLRPELLGPYRRFGFVETGIEPFKTGRPMKAGAECHCIVMSKAL